MTITHRATSTPVAASAANPATSTPTAPSGWVTGDRIFVWSVSEPSGTAPTLSANGTGWTQGFDAAVNSERLTCWWRDKDASWSTMPTVSVNGGSSSTNALITAASAFITDASWVTPTSGDLTTGSDTTSGTGFAATGAANLGCVTGNYLVALCACSGNTTSSAQTLTATGATLGTATELADLGTGNGGAIGLKLIGATVNSGTETGAPAVSLTLNGSNTGGVYFFRMRDQVAAQATNFFMAA